MGADPDAPGRHVAQHPIESRPVLAVGDRIDPDEHAIELQELLAYDRRHVVGIDRRLGVNADGGKRLEDAAETVVVSRGVASSFTIPAPQHRQSNHGDTCVS